MLGNKITQFDQHSVGIHGYTVVIDTTDLLLNSIEFIQADDNGTTGDPAPEQSDIEIIHSYLNDVDCPDIAWNLSSDVLTLFFKTTAYPYTATTYFVIYGYRNNQPISSMDSPVDIKDKDLEWFLNLSIKKAAELTGKKVPVSVENRLKDIQATIN